MQAAFVLLLLVAAAPQLRTWTDSTGTRKVEASFESVVDGKVRLKKADGSIADVPLSRLSAADRQFVLQVTAPADRMSKPIASRSIARIQAKPVTAAIILPDHAATDVVTLDVNGNDVEVELVLPPNCPCDLKLESPEFGAAWKITYQDQPVAHIARKPGRLSINWDENCPLEAECLRNAVLIVKARNGKQAYSLRAPIEVDPPFVDLVNRSTAVPIDMPLFGLRPKDLKLEVSGFLDGQEAKSRFPGNGRVDHGNEVRLLIRNEPPHAAVNVIVGGYEQPAVRIEPVFVALNGKRLPWTDKQLKQVRTSFVNAISKGERDIPKLEGLIPRLEDDLSGLKSQYDPDAVNAGFVANQIAKVEGEINRSRNRLKLIRENLPKTKQNYQNFEELFKLSEGIHQQWKVGYRVFFVAGEHEVTLVQMKLGSS